MIRSLKDLVDLRPATQERLRRIIQIGGGGGGKGSCFFATITASEIDPETTKRVYTWEEFGGGRTGSKAVDIYSGVLSLVGETVLMIRGSQGKYRFCFDRPWQGTMHECGTGWAKIEDPGDTENLITVDRTAGFYQVGDGVLIAPKGAGAWTIVDRIPMVMYEPLSEGGAADSSNTPAPFQDAPNTAGCDA